MALPHVYDKIARLEPDGEGLVSIILEDGTKITLPPTAYESFSKLEVGDRVLLDLTDWDKEPGRAFFRAWREWHLITHFGVGTGCQINSPALE